MELRLDDEVVSLGAPKQRALLAMLALNANEHLSADRLSEGLWGEQQPATAPKMVQLYVSRLRKELGSADAEIVTRGRGYELRIAPEAVDALRFERAVEAGDAAGALALWDGGPLGDLADEPFAAEQIRRLEELWLRARELVIDAALERGDNATALREAEELLPAHPFREHVQAQRMLALYRSGRQADAIEAYHDARRRLLDEIGIEPGPELRALNDAILAQDPGLGAVAVPRPVAPKRGRGRALAAGAVAALIVLGVVLVATRSSSPGDVAVTPNSIAVIDPAHNRVSADIPTQFDPGPLGAADGHVWVLSPGSQTLTRIDAARRRIMESAGIGGGEGSASTLAVVPHNLWVLAGCQQGGAQADVLRLDTTLRPISIPENTVGIPLDLPGERGRHQAPQTAGAQCGMGALGRTIWIATPIIEGIARLDITPPTSPVADVTKVRPLPFVPPVIAADAGALWVRDPRASALWRLDPRTLQRTAIVQTGTDPVAVAIGGGSVWVANAGDGSVSRIDPQGNISLHAITVGSGPIALAVGAGAVWVANGQDGTVSRIDPATNRVVATIKLGHKPQGITVQDGAVWVSVRA